MADELEARSRMAGTDSEAGRVLSLMADELRKRLEAGWRTRTGLPMTYFRIDLAVPSKPNGQVAYELMCG
jgi:hypothetical protein